MHPTTAAARPGRGGGPPALTDGPQSLPRPRSFEEWLSASLQQAIHHFKAAAVALARQDQVDKPRAALAW